MEEDYRSAVVPGRYSGDKATSSKTREPHYLRTSTGSCHDFCKFGRQHAFDVKERRSMPKRLGRVSVSPEIKKTVVPAKALSVSKSVDSGEIVNDGKPLMVKSRTSISSKMSNSGTRTANEMKIPSPSGTKADSSTSKSIKMSNSDTRKVNEMKIPSPSGTKANSSTSKSIKMSNSDTRKANEMKIPSPSGTKANSWRSNSIANSSMPKSIRLNSSKSKLIKANSSMSKNIGQGGRIVGTSNVKASKRVMLSSPKFCRSPKPVDRNANSIDQKQKIRKIASPRVNSIRRVRKDESNKHEYEEVEEKTLYVIKMETGKNSQLNCSSLSHGEGGDRVEAETTPNEAEHEAFPEIGDVKMVINKKGSLKKVESPPPSKLSFRRGKVVEIQSQANTPRRLKFRQAKLLGETPKIGDSRRRNLKKVEEFECKSMINGQKSGEKVVLKHRDMQGKKNSQGLFNNVIEETASKLVETRKSKVKALVGAFETVISLQEIKPFAL